MGGFPLYPLPFRCSFDIIIRGDDSVSIEVGGEPPPTYWSEPPLNVGRGCPDLSPLPRPVLKIGKRFPLALCAGKCKKIYFPSLYEYCTFLGGFVVSHMEKNQKIQKNGAFFPFIFKKNQGFFPAILASIWSPHNLEFLWHLTVSRQGGAGFHIRMAYGVQVGGVPPGPEGGGSDPHLRGLD